jgi:hypothetical protein
VAALANGHVLRDAAETKPGNDLSLTLRKGRVDCRVTATYPEKS